jgi:hypothetical protein
MKIKSNCHNKQATVIKHNVVISKTFFINDIFNSDASDYTVALPGKEFLVAMYRCAILYVDEYLQHNFYTVLRLQGLTVFHQAGILAAMLI